MRTLDLEEAAQFLKCSTWTLSQLAHDGIVPGAKVGRAWVFVDDHLADWLKSQYLKTGEEKWRRASSSIARARMETGSPTLGVIRDDELEKALGRPIGGRPRSGRGASRRNSGKPNA